MDLVSQLTLQGANKQPITFTIDKVVTQWHDEKLNEVYADYSDFYDTKEQKLNLSSKQRLELNSRMDDKYLELFIKAWDRDLPLTPENIKRSLKNAEFSELLRTVKKVESDDSLTEEKKSPSSESSSPASIPTETPTEQ